MTGINVIGMPFGLHGLGLEMRDKVHAMQSAGIDVCVLEENYSSLSRKIGDPKIEALVSAEAKYDVNLFCHNLPAIGLIHTKRPELFEGRINCAAPYWEFPELPERHKDTLELLDEIWVSNQFLGACFGAHTDKPVVELPLHISVNSQKPAPRPADGEIVFGYVFDFNSMAARKDPNILVLAFLEAFSSDPKAPVKLLMKYNLERSTLVRERDVAAFLALADLDDRIEVIDAALRPEEMDAFLNGIDVYISPHRAEGLGRGIIEMMVRSRAVAATAYSGPKQFLDPGHATLIEHFPSHVGADALGDIEPGFSWVEAKLESVISAMKEYADEPALAKKKGEMASAFLSKNHGPSKHGKACLDRLTQLSG